MKNEEKQGRGAFAPLAGLLLTVLAVSVIVSAGLGRYPISVREIMGIMASKLMPVDKFWTATQESLLLVHRLPRIALACLVGCSLSAAGAAYQGVFQNPMAAPDILGASSGAGFGAALAILLGLGKGMITVSAFCGGLAAVGIVMLVGSRARGNRVLGLILAGVMVGSLASSGTSFIKLVADPLNQLPVITYWLMGSLNGASGSDIMIALIPMLCGAIPLLLLRWRINLLVLGDDEAKSMGIHAGRLRAAVIVCATLMTAASVSVCGVIGWVGLVIPHMARGLTGSDYRRLMPVSMLLGALFLLLVDDVSRTLMVSEIPIGILTSLLGAPFFIYLILKGGERIEH